MVKFWLPDSPQQYGLPWSKENKNNGGQGWLPTAWWSWSCHSLLLRILLQRLSIPQMTILSLHHLALPISLASSCSILLMAFKVPYPGQAFILVAFAYTVLFICHSSYSQLHPCFSLKISSSEKPLLIFRSNCEHSTPFTICLLVLHVTISNSWLWYLETVPWRQVLIYLLIAKFPASGSVPIASRNIHSLFQ